jgi:hypothetical protein
VAFGATPDKAVAQALASGEVGDWEAPEAKPVPLDFAAAKAAMSRDRPL